MRGGTETKSNCFKPKSNFIWTHLLLSEVVNRDLVYLIKNILKNEQPLLLSERRFYFINNKCIHFFVVEENSALLV